MNIRSQGAAKIAVDNFGDNGNRGIDFMALVWVEPFDLYGTNVALLANRGYTASAIANITNTAANVRTGSGAGGFNGNTLRKALDNPTSTLGMGYGLQQVSLGLGTAGAGGMRFESAGNTVEVTVNVGLDNSISVWDRTNTLVGKSQPNAIILSTYFWVEAKCVMNAGGVINTGSVEVRVNGVQKVLINGVNLPNQFAYATIGSIGGSSGSYNIDDWIVWDNTGVKNNDFMGDRRLFVSYPNANLALQDFTASAAPAWDRLNDSPPVDTSYIDGALAGNVSEFSKSAIGIASNDIAAVVLTGRLFKTDAGVAAGRLGINSNGFVANSAEQFPGTTGAWFQFIQELDPNGNIAWTRAAVDAAALRITRSQ